MAIYDPIALALGIEQSLDISQYPTLDQMIAEHPPFVDGSPAWNAGIPNPEQSARFKTNNPMKDPISKAKRLLKIKGRPAHNKIRKTFIWTCEECGKSEERRDTVKLRKYRFCDKSCAGSHENRLRWKDPVYNKKVGEAISKAKRS